ncbi:tandem-95 repeat protein [Epibacterium sp. SM1969]|uniref:Tandem-95 repeat protein n=1 Tax=Tritonibacter aquimaris TaxID=2663379 RepID=A0A844ANT0_9RHOB|nr:tandem-95 repeat protein [Tritonibacter aquimaris]MQY44380.1 tandem-95 repeat protein [Tritonibacter aquimaris]
MDAIISKVVSDLSSEFLSLDAATVLPEATVEAQADAKTSSHEDEDRPVELNTSGAVLDADGGAISIDFGSDDTGVDIGSVSRWSSLGRELGVDQQTPAFVINARGATAEINGETITANHFSLQNNTASAVSTVLLSATALETTLQLASVALNTNSITATAGDDRYFGYDEDAEVFGGAGNDYFRSLGGDKSLYGESGDDSFYVRGGAGVLVDGGTGADEVSFAGERSGLVIESIGRFGALGRELDLDRETSAYSVYENGATADFNGEDVRARYSVINNNVAQGSDEPLSDTALETALKLGHVVRDVEEITGSRHDDAFFGSRSADAFNAGDGNDWIDSRAGDDLIDAGAGNDRIVLTRGNNTIDGGEGVDQLWLRGAPEDFQITHDGSGEYTIVTASGDVSTVKGVENARFSDGSIVALEDLARVIDPEPTPDPVPTPDPEPTPLPEIAAADDAGSVLEDGAVVLDLLGNDTGDSLTITAVDAAGNGSVTLNDDGTVTYRPAADFAGNDQFTYTVRDSAGQTSSATVAVAVQQVNDAPVVVDVTAPTILESAASGSSVAQIVAQDLEGDALSYEIVSGNEDGLFEIDSSTGEVRLADEAELDFETATSHNLEVRVSDGDAAVVTGVTIEVADVDEGRPEADELIASTDRALGVSDGSGSIGLTGAHDWDSQLPFLDIMKFSRPVKAHGYDDEGSPEFGTYGHKDLEDQGYLDDHGWPTSIPEDSYGIGFVFSETVGREGTYVLRYEGEGELRLLNDANIISQSDGEIVFEHTSGTFEVRIDSTDPEGSGDHIRNISIVKEEYVDIYDAGAVFNPEALEVLQDFREFRTMAWQRTIESPIETLDDLPSFDDANWVTEYGAPIEVLVQLSNEAGTDLWFNIPTKASAEVVEYYATYIRDNLDPNLKVTVEFGNELWNYGYHDTHDLRREAIEAWDLAPDDNVGRFAYIAKKATGVALQFNEIFDQVEDGERPAIHHTFGTQTASTTITNAFLRAEAWQLNEPETFVPPAEVFDSIAVTTYFGGASLTDEDYRADLIAAIEDPDVDAQAFLFERLNDPQYTLSVPKVAEYLEAQKEIVDRYGIGLTDYEGGAHILHSDNTGLPTETINELQDFFVEFYRSDYMRELFQSIWDVWREVGTGAFTNHGSVGEPSKFGFFSFLSDLNDTSPRAEFLWEQNANEAAWWEDRGGEHFQQGVTETGTDGDDLLIGTNQEDYLSGGEGDDYIVAGVGNDGINGGEGADTVLLAGSRGEYDIYRDGDAVIFRHAEGTDRVLNIEYAEFQSGEFFSIEELVKSADAPNEGPLAVDDVLEANEDERTTFTTLLLNDHDADGGTLVVAEVGEAEHGIVRLEADGSVTYIPAVNFVGEDSFTYVVSDGVDRSTATATVTVHNQADAPIVESEHLNVFNADVQAGDVVHQVDAFDLDGDALRYSIVDGNEAGLFAIDAQTGEITTTAELEPDKTKGITEFDLTVAVADQALVTEAAISIDVHHRDNIVSESSVAGEILDGGLGDNDIFQLTAYNGRGRAFGVISGGDQFRDLEDAGYVETSSTSVYRSYTARYEAEVDGEAVLATGKNFDGQNLDFVLNLANFAVNFEAVIGTEFYDSIFGSSGADTYYGAGGSDFITGGGGDDLLVGGAGSDNIFGGSGADTFVFDSFDGVDRLRDFSVEEGDTLDIGELLIGFDADLSSIADFVSLGVDADGNQTLAVSAAGNGEFVDVARFTNETALTLAELEANNSILFI